MFTSTAELEAALAAYVAHNNEHPKPFVWTKSADAILASVSRYLPTNFWLRPLYAEPA